MRRLGLGTCSWRSFSTGPLRRPPPPRRPLTHAAVRTCSSAESAAAHPPSQAPRFYVPDALASSCVGAMLRLPAEEARHARVALRLREGDALEVCDGRGAVVQAVIAGSDKNGMTARAVAPPVLVPLPLWQWQVAVACGSLKGGRADWLVEKCAELGASALVPLLTERSRIVGGAGGRQGREKLVQKRRDGDEADQSMSASEGGREARWLRVSTAAMKQCLRAHSMHITAPCTVDALCADLQGASAVFVGVAGAPPLHQAAAEVAQRLQPAGEVDSTSRRGVLLIGPEGDFTQQELANLAAAGATPVGLGDLRLRAETAAVTMLAYVRLAFP